MSTPASSRTEVAVALHEALREAGITFAASLPDDWVLPLIMQLDQDPAITQVRVSREPEIVGLCSGAFFGGVNAVGVLGSTGFLTCISELNGLCLKHGIPIFLIVSLRSGVYEFQPFQETQARTMQRLIGTLDYPSVVIDRVEKIELIPHAFRASRLHKRPLVAWLTKSLLTASQSDF